MTAAWGRCGACHRSFQLTAKGLVRVHFDGRKARQEGTHCPGSGLRPVEALS
jgi:hypothetical protein